MEYAAQFDMLAQGSGIEEWVNILFIAIMAILWLVGGLLKAASKRKPQQKPGGLATGSPQQQESWQERLRRKAEEMQRRLEGQTGLRAEGERPRPAQRPTARPSQVPGGKVTVREGQKGESILVYEGPQTQTTTSFGSPAPSQVQPSIERERHGPPVRPISERLPRVTAGPPESLELGELKVETSDESAGFQSAEVIDYSDPDALKKAILHYEILGKPVALREESEHMSAF
jgi:hypothetical protein